MRCGPPAKIRRVPGRSETRSSSPSLKAAGSFSLSAAACDQAASRRLRSSRRSASAYSRRVSTSQVRETLRTPDKNKTVSVSAPATATSSQTHQAMPSEYRGPTGRSRIR